MIIDLVRYSCGCIGTRPVTMEVGDEKRKVSYFYKVFDCRHDDDISLQRLHIPTVSESTGEKTYEELGVNEALLIVREISQLVHEGYRFREMKDLVMEELKDNLRKVEDLLK